MKKTGVKPMRSKNAWKLGLIITALLLGLEVVANAETTFHADTPANKVSAREALKLMKSQKEVFRCHAVKLGPKINPVNVTNAPTTWHTSTGKDLGEAGIERLSNGQKLIKCESVAIDENTLRVRKVAD
jgi:hypothetical protein